MSWSTDTPEKTNYTKLCRLLYDGGSKACRDVLNKECKPTLKSSLANNKTNLKKLKKPKGKVLNQSQWDELFPPTGKDPDPETMDITLLFVLLRNICPGLKKPSNGWDNQPSNSDNTREANLARIKYIRNKVIAHKPKAEISDAEFKTLWKDASVALVSLGIKQEEIDDLKSSPLSGQDYNKLVDEWDLADKEIKTYLDDIKSDTHEIKEMLQQQTAPIKSPVHNLKNYDCQSLRQSKLATYHQNTREWIFNEVDNHVKAKDPYNGNTIVIEAGPGMGKSVVAAKLCDIYSQQDSEVILGACHFFKHNDSLLNDPRLMFQYIARQLCESVPGYKDVLENAISTHIEKILQLNCTELCSLLLAPLAKIKLDSIVVVVIDAFDECNEMRSELCQVINSEFSKLPTWLRFIITTRPPPSISYLNCSRKISIKPNDTENRSDLEVFFNDKLKELTTFSPTFSNNITKLIEMTQGTFLVAFFTIHLMKTSKDESSTSELLQRFTNGGISSVYLDYFTRLKKAIVPYIDNEEGFFNMLDAVVQANAPIEKNIFYQILGLKEEITRVPDEKRECALNLLHQIFPVESGCVSTFHKTVDEWLVSGEHIYKANGTSGLLNQKYFDVMMNLNSKYSNIKSLQGFTSSELYVLGNSNLITDKEMNEKLESDTLVFCSKIIDSLTTNRMMQTNLDIRLSSFFAIVQYLENISWFSALHYDMKKKHEIQLEQLFPAVLQVMHLIKLENYIPLVPNTVDLLKEHTLPYMERHMIMKMPNLFLNHYVGSYFLKHFVSVPHSKVEILPCDNTSFFLVTYQHEEKVDSICTLLQKYKLDGRFVKEKKFSKHKTFFMSPKNRFIVAIPVLMKGLVKIIDASTLEVQNTLTPPNVIRSCHIYGNSKDWCILVRCFDNSIYVMDMGKNGNTFSHLMDIDQNEEVECVSNLGVIILSRNDATLSSEYGFQNFYTDKEGNMFEEMVVENGTNLPGNGTNLLFKRNLYLCTFKGNHCMKTRLNKRVVQPQVKCLTLNYHQGHQATHFSQDGLLFAYNYRGLITVLNTFDGTVFHEMPFSLGYSEAHILHLTNECIIVQNCNANICVYYFNTSKEYEMPVQGKSGHLNHFAYSAFHVTSIDEDTEDGEVSLIVVCGNLDEIEKDFLMKDRENYYRKPRCFYKFFIRGLNRGLSTSSA